MKCLILSTLVAFLLFASPALAVDPKPAGEHVIVIKADPIIKPIITTYPYATADDDAEDLINDSISGIDEDPGATVSQLIQLAKEGRWGPFVGLLLMFLIWILRKFIWKRIPKDDLPWLTLGIGMLATCATETLLGVVWWKVLIDGLGTSGIAMAFWSLAFKHFLKPAKEEKQEDQKEGA